ncbi:MAG: PqqD family protein, partial [Planctomycetota bacterium]
MALFGRKGRKSPQLSRGASLSARPVLSRLVKLERAADGSIILQIPRRDSAMARTVARAFRMPPYKRVALDELGTFVIELCDGEHAVKDIVDKFVKRFKLSTRQAEVSTTDFLRILARRSVIGLVVEA